MPRWAPQGVIPQATGSGLSSFMESNHVLSDGSVLTWKKWIWADPPESSTRLARVLERVVFSPGSGQQKLMIDGDQRNMVIVFRRQP